MTRRFAERRWRAPDGVEIHFRDYPGGDGPPKLPVICLHGLTRNSGDFEEVAPVIASIGRRVLVPDIRGRGRSGRDPDPMNYVPKTYARDVIGLLEALGVSRAAFLGTSMGGIITMLVAARRPRIVASAILNDIGPEAAPEGLARIAGYAGRAVDVQSWPEAASYVREINGEAFSDSDDEFWDRFARRTFREDGSRLSLDYDPQIRAPIMAGKLKVPGFVAWWLFRRLARARPLLLLRGERSDILSRDIAERMEKAAPRMELVEIPNTGHAPLLSEPEAEAAIMDFLGRVA